MNQEQELDRLLERELSAGCYDKKVASIEIYHYLYRFARIRYFEGHGYKYTGNYGNVSWFKKIKFYFISIFQLLKLLPFKKVDNILHVFRLFETNGTYLDKFIDPILEFSELKNSKYVIFEPAIGGVHRIPRLHKDKVVYTDSIDLIARVIRIITQPFFNKRHGSEFNELWKSLDVVMDGIEYDKAYFKIVSNSFIIRQNIYYKIFSRLKSKRLFAASKSAFREQLYAAKRCGMKVYELQHGIIWGNSIQYLVPFNGMFIPDCFLMYGGMCPKDKFGVPVDRIKLLGFAYLQYVENMVSDNNKKSNSVFVISDPIISEDLFDTIKELALNYPSYTFCIRLHPMEVLSEKQLKIIKETANVRLENNKTDIMLELQKYEMVVGGNTTVMYEASSIGKKVGKFAYPWITPIFINPSDKDVFWLIEDDKSFGEFLEAENNKRKVEYYSAYDNEVINELLME